MEDVHIGDSFPHILAPLHHATLLTKHRLKDTVIKPSRLVTITTASLPPLDKMHRCLIDKKKKVISAHRSEGSSSQLRCFAFVLFQGRSSWREWRPKKHCLPYQLESKMQHK